MLEVLPALRQYKQAVDDKKLKRPDTKSYKHVADGCADPLLEVKLHATLYTKCSKEPTGVSATLPN